MDRLTKTYIDGTHGAADNLPYGENSYRYKVLLIESLGEYEEAENQGLLVRLPCGIGADVYFIHSKTNFLLNLLNRHEEENRVFHQTVDRITFKKGGWYMECDSDLKYGTGRILLDTSYGVTWFLTREEAEAKLKEMEKSHE